MYTGNNIRPNSVAFILIFSGLMLSACQKIELTRLVKIKTGDCLNLMATSATLTGELVDAGEDGVIQYGLCWSTSPNPTPDNSNLQTWGWSADANPFQAEVIGLSWNTKYYFRSYCMVVASETIFGEEKSFITPYDAVFYKLPTGVAPLIDGEIDDVWNKIEKQDIKRSMINNNPTILSTYWKGIWNDTAIYILVLVNEDSHCDHWCSGESEWFSDRVEIYFDVNEVLKDGIGPNIGPELGHYQFAPAWKQDTNSYNASGADWRGRYFHYAYQITGTNYIYEYAFPWRSLTDNKGFTFSPVGRKEFGFDVAICDWDEMQEGAKRQYKVWRNMGGSEGPDQTGPWFNMDGAGVVVINTNEIDYP